MFPGLFCRESPLRILAFAPSRITEFATHLHAEFGCEFIRFSLTYNSMRPSCLHLGWHCFALPSNVALSELAWRLTRLTSRLPSTTLTLVRVLLHTLLFAEGAELIGSTTGGLVTGPAHLDLDPLGLVRDRFYNWLRHFASR